MSASPHARLRVGIVVPRYGHSAVDRNRLKRRLREFVRLHILPLGVPSDVVIWAQRSAYRLDFAQLQGQMELVVTKLQRTREVAGGTTPGAEGDDILPRPSGGA